MNLSLDNKIALITGGGRDVGREIALTLAAEGVKVAINYRTSAAAAETVVAEITAAGGSARAWKADIGNEADTAAMVEDIVATFGGIDILVNNAGVAERVGFLETTEAQWRRHIDVGLIGTVNTSKAALPHMVKAGRGGRIVPVSIS